MVMRIKGFDGFLILNAHGGSIPPTIAIHRVGISLCVFEGEKGR